jgi:hypothetical protein
MNSKFRRNTEGVLTQYYLKEHIAQLMDRGGFAIKSTEKLEYSWTHEVGHTLVPAGSAQPWDWLVVAQREG